MVFIAPTISRFVYGIMSISTGLTGDERTNLHNDYEIGVSLMPNIVGDNFAKVKFQRKKSHNTRNHHDGSNN